MSTRVFTAMVQKEDDGWVSFCPELDIASQGESIEQARANLVEAIELFFETASETEISQRLHGETYVTPLEVQIG